MNIFENEKFGIIVLFCLMLLPMFISDAHSEDIYGRIVGVTDGDTATLLDSENKQHTIRLFAIDAPETSCHQKKPSASDDVCLERSQPFGKAAKRSLSKLIYDKEVRVRLEKGSTFGREIGTIFVGNVNANLEQVKTGHAWAYRQYMKHMPSNERDNILNAEKFAKENKLGLWSIKDPVAPWDWRHSK